MCQAWANGEDTKIKTWASTLEQLPGQSGGASQIQPQAITIQAATDESQKTVLSSSEEGEKDSGWEFGGKLQEKGTSELGWEG